MTDTNVTAVAGQLMRAVVRSGAIRQQDAAVAARIMREELKALLFGEKYADERALIVKTILKILDECSDAEYDFAEINFRDKLIAAGVTFDAE